MPSAASCSLGRRLAALVLALLPVGCAEQVHEPAPEAGETAPSDVADTEDIDAESTGSPPLDESGDPSVAACDGTLPIEELPYAFLVPERAAGQPRWRLILASHESTCDNIDIAPAPGHTRVSLVLPRVIVPQAFSLDDLGAFAAMSPGAPGSSSSVNALAFLHGQLLVETIGRHRMSATLCDHAVPFTGSLEAVVCE